VTEPLKVFSTNLRAARKARRLTQESVAYAAAMDQSQYSRIERAKVDPSIRTLVRVAAAVGSTPSELLQGVHAPPLR
jgi:transcriptional regulator with XRE-family HTH domain